MRVLLGQTPGGSQSLRITDSDQRVRLELGVDGESSMPANSLFDPEGIEIRRPE